MQRISSLDGVNVSFDKYGQAHEGMTTAPEMYAAAVSGFLLS
jgi:hypothetical protein